MIQRQVPQQIYTISLAKIHLPQKEFYYPFPLPTLIKVGAVVLVVEVVEQILLGAEKIVGHSLLICRSQELDVCSR